MMKITAILIFSFFLIQKTAAHCPLCTAGAGAAAGIAAYLGIDFAVMGVLLGGFSWALGSWTAKWVKKKIGQKIPYQSKIVTLLIFASIIIPGYFWMPAATPFTLWFVGEYGTTISVNNFLLGSLAGGSIVYSTPFLSKKISKFRGRTVPYQGMTLTVALLLITALVLQIVM